MLYTYVQLQRQYNSFFTYPLYGSSGQAVTTGVSQRTGPLEQTGLKVSRKDSTVNPWISTY